MTVDEDKFSLSFASDDDMGGKQDVVCGGHVEIPYKLTLRHLRTMSTMD